MNGNTTQIMIDIKDLFCVILKKALVILLVGVVFALAGMFYKEKSYSKTISVETTSVLDISTKRLGESDVDFEQRVSAVSRAISITSQIDTLNEHASEIDSYNRNSLLMQMDPLNTYVTRLQVVIILNGNVESGVYATLRTAYEQDILYGDYLNSVAQSLGYDVSDIRDVIHFCELYDESDRDAFFVNGSDSPRIMIIEVLGESNEFTDYLADAIVNEFDAVSEVYSSVYEMHQVAVLGRQDYTGFNEYVSDKQVDSVKLFCDIQRNIDNLNTSLDNIAKELGLSGRSDLNMTVSTSSVGVSKVPLKSLIKYGLAGFFLWLFIASIILSCNYIWGRKILSQRQFFMLFDDIKKIGICKPLGKRSFFVSYIDRKSSDDTNLPVEQTNKIIKASFVSQTSGMNKVLITGTADEGVVTKTVKDLHIEGDVKLDLFKDPDIITSASSYDGIVLVEQRGHSEKKNVKEEIRLLTNSGTKIVGAIII